ncbi:hypothetical protein ABTY61_22725 [Kitasatospora sp. NPDC096128]|uniref:hypothetical protein n=1 Tax=Kitasatospora sp. NPDC096128 TaxID=3155547 RepID=UPI003326E688
MDLVLYHRTDSEAAAAILASRRMVSHHASGLIWFSNRPDDPNGTDYGDTLVTVRLPAAICRLDQTLPHGEKHYTVHARDLRPHHFD